MKWLTQWWQSQWRRSLSPPLPAVDGAAEGAGVFSGPGQADAGLPALPLPPRPAILQPQPPEKLFPPEALQRAWLILKQAGGGPGVDGVTVAQFGTALETELATLRTELIQGRYRPRPLRQVLVPKQNGGLRPLALWALRDRIAQRVVYELLAPTFEASFLPCSFGFRPGHTVADAVQQVLNYRDAHLRWVVDGDIRNCFDEIECSRLLRLVQRRVKDRLLLRYVQAWLQADILNSADGVARQAGASQGSVLSPLFANIYLHEFDQVLTGQRLALVRYADDFVVCCRRKDEAQAAWLVTERALAGMGLALNPHKSRIVHLDEGLAWLGHFFVRGGCYPVRR